MNPDAIKNLNGGPVFPGSHPEIDPRNPGWVGGGLSMRDYFAAKAFAMLMHADAKDYTPEQTARQAYRFADAMLAAREAA